MSDEARRVRARREATLWRLLLRALEAHAGEVTAHIHAGGFPEMREGWPRVLAHLDTEGTRLGVIARRIGVTAQGAGKLVREIEEAGFVERSPDPRDARAVLVRFTPRGRAMLDAALAAMADVEARTATAMGRAPFHELKLRLTQLLAAVDPDGGLAPDGGWTKGPGPDEGPPDGPT